MRKTFVLLLTFMLFLTSCSVPGSQSDSVALQDAIMITLSDEGIQADGKAVGTDATEAIYIANDIVYYESGKDFTYGEGTENDAHTQEEADSHTVLHITKAGKYALSGKLSQGQIAVDLGEDAKKDPEAIVTLVLNNVDITCKVAPAIIFYRVYECENTDADHAAKDVDTSAAGANILIADGAENTVHGSYVERIYDPESVVLTEDKTEVNEASKLHKYDGAFYSKMSMNINGSQRGTGILNIYAQNEGLDSEMHLTINGGNIYIESGNDGINTNEDGISVTTVNGGKLTIRVTGETGEGDGIDSNGWLVINGGTVIASACSNSADAGIDSDMGIHILGGTVLATGHMLDRIEDSGQTYAVFSFAQLQEGNTPLSLKNEKGKTIMESIAPNTYSILIFSSPDLTSGNYTLWNADTQLAGQSGGMMGGPGIPEGMPDGEPPKDFDPQKKPQMPEGKEPQMPGDKEPPMGQKPPEGTHGMGKPDNGSKKPLEGFNPVPAQDRTTDFTIANGGNMFSNISPAA